MDELPLTKPKRIVLVASLLLVIVLFLTTLETISVWQQDRIGWLIASIRPFVISIFTIVVLYLLNGRSQGLAEKLHRLRLSLLFPALEEFVEDQRRRHANRLVAEKMDVTLNFYRLTVLNPPENPKPEVIGKWRARWRRLWLRWRRPPEKAQIVCRARVADKMPLLVLLEEDRIKNCASLLEKCGVFTESGKAVPADLLYLLYCEQHGLETLLVFEEIGREEAKRERLSQILLESKQLPQRRLQLNPPLMQFFTEVAVLAELEKMTDFSLASLVEKLKRRQQQVAAYQIVVDKMYHTLDYFGLVAPDNAKDALIDAALEEDDPDKVLAHCGQAVGPLVIHSPLVLELLYRWLYGMDTAVLYKQLNPAQDLPDLAAVLLNGRWLPTRWQSQPFSQEEIITSLEEIADFDLKELQNKLLTRQRQIRAYQSVVDRMQEILTVFNLGSLEQEAYTRLMDKAPESDDPDTLIAHCTTAIAEVVTQPKELLNLLYRDEQRLAQSPGWQKHIPVLVGVLAQNPRLPQKELGENRTEPFSQEEICQALKQLPHFSLEGLIKQLLANEAKRREGVAILRRMEYALNYYRLFNRLQEGTAHLTGKNGTWAFSRDFQQDYCARLPDQFNPEEYTSRCAATVASRLAPTTELPSANKLVELVYRERNGLQTADFWFKRRKELAPGMAELLVNSGKLPDPTVSMPYQPDSLQEMLQEHEDFSLNFIRDEVDHISVLWRVAVKYHEFLKRHEIQGWKMDVVQLMQLLKPLPSAQSQLPRLMTRDLDILLWAGEACIKASVPAAQEHLRSYCQVALAIFLADETDPRSRQLLAQVCRDMGNSPDNTAVRISLAYVDLMADLEARQEAEVRDFVTVRSLIENWAKRDAHLQNTLKGYEKEILSLAQAFRRGEWLNHLWETLTQTLNDLKRANAPVKALVGNREHLVEALRRIFMRLDVRTIERFLEARTTTAYLIAFDSTKGSLASLLDSFMLRPDTFAAEKEPKRQRLWDAYRQLQELGVHLQTEDGRWLYNFCQYTFNTRIGVLPPGWNMREFAKVFGQDMATVTEASQEAKEALAPDYEWEKEFEATEVILHRFGLRNHYALELKSRSENAVNNMKRLFATHIDFDNLLATIGYENLELVDMAAAIMQGAILELAYNQQMTNHEQAKIARHDMALKLVLLWRSGRLGLQIDDLAILGKTLDEEQVKRIAQKLQEDVIHNTLERILSRHTGIASKVERLQLSRALLTHLTKMVKKNRCLTGMRHEVAACLQDPVLQADAWAAELVTLAFLQAAECLVMNEEEQDLIDEGIKDLAYHLAGVQVGDALQPGADWLAEAMIDLIPKIVANRCRAIATTYLGTLRDVAGLVNDSVLSETVPAGFG